MSSTTRSDVFGTDAPSPAGRRQALTMVLQASDLATAPARFWIDDVDAIVFGRGERSATRDRVDGLRRLVLRFPDPFMSADHGRMLRVHGTWMVESPRSKNGVVVGSRLTRAGTIEPGDILEVGHTLFLLEDVVVREDAHADVVLDPVGRSQPALASFHPDLIAAEASLARVAPSRIPVLFHGETGTGKEVYARVLHEASGRPGPFVAVNCGALSPSLLESELFGHRRGAFSGATVDRPGHIRSSDGGTLFLDEITELSQAGQVALLRVLQENEVVAVGDSRPVTVDVRVCAASQRPLIEEVEAGRFRSDLYARLLGYELRLPPLRERRADLGYLASNLFGRLSDRAAAVTLTPAAARALVGYAWPRNIRELERSLAAALVLAGDAEIDVAHLPAAVLAGPASGGSSPPAPARVPGEDDAVRVQLAAKLAEHHGNVSAVARDLGKHREQIQRWIRRYGFDVELFRR